MTTAVDVEAAVAEIVAQKAALEGALLPVLHDVHGRFGCIPAQAVPVIARGLNLSAAEVQGVISFYHDFRTTPGGRRHLKLCRAEACQASGGRELAARVLQHFAIGWGDTSADGHVTVSQVFCLGLCSVSPAVELDGQPLGRVRSDELIAELERTR